MNPRLGLIFFALFVAAKLPAMTINPLSITGDSDNISASFEINWGADLEGSNTLGGLVDGSWAGGNWEFEFGVGGLPSLGQEAFHVLTFRTVWTDGWIPGGLCYFQYFDYGMNGSQSVEENIPYDRPPQTAYDYSGLGLEYFLDLSAVLDFDHGSDFSGKETITYNLSRSPINATVATASVPDGGVTLALLGGALAGVALLRRRFAGLVA